MENTGKPFFASNIGLKGRIVRGAGGLLMCGGAAALWQVHWLLTLLLGLSGAFMLFESLRGWCVLRACKIRTPL
jgi:hypothetical protein